MHRSGMLRLVACLSLGLVAPALSLLHAAGTLVSGPLLGYQTHREVAIWVEVEDAREVSLSYVRADLPDGATQAPVTVTRPAPPPGPAGGQPMKFVLGPLEMGARYSYSISIDGRSVARPYPLGFRTTAQFEWRAPAPDFSFLLGSCAYFNDAPYDRPGKPYGSGREDIWGTMAASGADFMLWLGDTVYLREADFSSASGIWYRQRTDRATPALQPFLAAMPHYATWDDHEFGPNNANGDWPLAPVARAAFEAYWPNQSFGTPRDPSAIYHRFQWADAQFLLLDNRTHRVDSTTDGAGYPKVQYGAEQMRWLKQQLASRNEGGARRHQALTFVVTGSQFLARRIYPGSEDHQRYERERAEIVEFIRANKIGGVVFLTGDVHYSEVLRRDDLLPYPLYEFTSSSLTAGAHTRPLPEDPGRVLAVQRNNYCRIAVSGPADSRRLVYTVHDETGAELARHELPLADLRWPEPAS